MVTHSGSTRMLRRGVLTAAIAIAAALIPATGALATQSPHPGGKATARAHPASRVCAQPTRRGFAACLAFRRTDVPGHKGLFAAGSAPSGYGPADLQGAYNLPSASAGNGATVAIVDAFDDPNAEADLAVYRQQYGLPPCTTANGCFRKVAQDGSTRYPPSDGNWAAEISLDLDMVSAICPKCHILLAEANDNSMASLGAAVNEAVALGAKYVSNSYGGFETSSEAQSDSAYYNHPGVVVTASSGDSGYGVSYPAASPDVTAVGGTTLTRDASVPRGWTETAWGGAGSGCSGYEAKPSWQHDSGCQNRTVADVSAVADPSTGVAIYDTYPFAGTGSGWNVFGGTSASSPVIASTYALAGTPFGGSNPASYPYAGPSALNDVTSGSNGTCSPAYLCTAGPGYDGPTGLGTPDGTAAFTLPHGDITGTVTDAATGKPLAGAIVRAGTASATTGQDGSYDIAVPTGSYDVTAMDFSGYATQSQSGVQVGVGQSVTENFALQPAPSVTLSGTVTDGSGQGWPLYAKVSLAGTPVAAYTDPATGQYHLSVPQNGTYTLQENPVYPGYQQASQNVTTGSASVTQNFANPIDTTACTAPGYHNVPNLSETFDQNTTPPGWSIVTSGDPGDTWRFDQPGGWPNRTGGSGNYAVAYETSGGPSDTELISPVINLSANLHPVLQFDSYSGQSWTGQAVELSIDGGQTWTSVWSTVGFGGNGHWALPLPQAAGKPSVQLRFHYTDTANLGLTNANWQVDDVTVSGCGKVPGGLVEGRVTDANTGQGVDGATVTSNDQPGQSGGTVATPGDPNIGGGLYWLFSSLNGSHPFTASAPDYTAQTSSVDVTAGQVTRADFTLKAGQLAVAPGSVTATQQMGTSATASVTVRNTGTAPASVTISSQPGGFTLAGLRAGARLGAPLQRIRGHFSPHILRIARIRQAEPAVVRPATAGPADGQWVPTASYPVQAADVASATDPATGKVYAAGGWITTGLRVASSYMLDPRTGVWTALPPMPHARGGAQAAFIGGKLYVTGGHDNYQYGAAAGMDIYNPASGQWTAGAPILHSYFGAGSAVLNGKMYVVGGCDPGYGYCGMQAVQVYSPGTDTWTSAAPYPVPVSWLGCGGIGGKLYCAGGITDTTGSSYSAGYVYDPRTNAWSPIPSMPADLWGGADAAANGQLVISGGVTANSTVITNQGYAYDPATGKWSQLPNAPTATYRAAGACGFYRIGGFYNSLFPYYSEANAAQLPGYGDCGGQPWLSASPASTTLAPGQSTTITVTLNAANASISQPGTYTAALRLGSNTPYAAQTVPVSLTATPPKTWGKLAGTVSGLNCDGTTTPLPGATVQVSGSRASWVLTTDTSGRYALWLDTRNNPLTLIVSAPGRQPQAATVKIQALATTTRNFTLARTATCP